MVFIIGVAGDSGTGKSQFADLVKDLLKDVSHISLDDYHKYGREERKKLNITPLNPKANDFKTMEEHLKLIKEGTKFKKPIYDHKNGVILKDAEVFYPKKIVVVEGLLPFYKKTMRNYFDVKIFFDIEDKIRMKWKLERDFKKRNYKKEWDLEQRKIDYKKYVEPQKKFSDIILKVEEGKYGYKTTINYTKAFLSENYFDFTTIYKYKKRMICLDEDKIVLDGVFEREDFPEMVKMFERNIVDVRIPMKMNSFTAAQFIIIYQLFLTMKEGGVL